MIDKNFLESVGITDEETVNKIVAEYGNDIKAEKNAAETLKTQLSEANTQIESYKGMDIEGIRKSAEEYKQKVEQLEAEQKAKDYSDKLDKFVQNQGMRNDIYSAHLKSQLSAAELKFDKDGVLIGGEEIVKKLRESCPDAFADTKPKPEFVESTPGSTEKTPDDDYIRTVMGLK